ncbi:MULTISPECIES: HAD hydrolase-like protein [Rhodomicrobium]|uniref:HAD hydrolase-like protein n=1 Tax=Rhodomicrobium TaxID=1068 RepID=UPI000F74019D|nr:MULTISPECIES: HAD hydrolase-like protein [Rhodomicrobium]
MSDRDNPEFDGSGSTSTTPCISIVRRRDAPPRPARCIFIGDNLESDILPALALGIEAFYVGADAGLPAGVRKLSSLAALHRFLD